MSFTKVFSGALVACLALTAQAQIFSNGTATSSSAAATGTAVAPAVLTVGGKTWNSLGCAANSLNFEGFVQLETSPLMTIEKCLADCSTYEFAGLNGPKCFCSNYSDNATVIVPAATCDYPCKGNPSETCGGSSIGAPAPASKRQVTAGVLLTLYQAAANAIIPAGPYTTILATQYVDVCPTGLTTVVYSTTVVLEHCGCTNTTPVATIPMTTSVGSCGCGVSGALQTYTVTVPAAVAATATTTPAGGAAATGAATTAATTPVFTGAASHNGVAAGFVGAAALVAAML